MQVNNNYFALVRLTVNQHRTKEDKKKGKVFHLSNNIVVYMDIVCANYLKK